MKVSKEQAAEHHRAIIEAAATLFREEGFDGVNVSDIMKAAGLTHGAFYGHFSSKSALGAAACKYAFDEVLERWTDDISLSKYLDKYLSTLHRDSHGRGCPMAAFASEIDRQDSDVQEAYQAGVARYLKRIAACISDSGAKAGTRNADASAILAAMVGSIVLARSTVTNRAFSARVLADARSALTARFGV
jgi:TetR/AcrR family transcriptional repressor of nem operon